MKNIFFLILLSSLIISCSSYNQSKELNNQSAQLAHSKLSNVKNDFSYDEYKLLIIEYGKNSKFPDISK